MKDYLTGQRFEFAVDLDKERLIRIDFNALCRAEEVSGLSFLDWDGDLTGNRLKALVWASIVYGPEEERLTYDQVGDILNAKVLDVLATMSEAWLESMPVPTEGETTEDPQKAVTAPS